MYIQIYVLFENFSYYLYIMKRILSLLFILPLFAVAQQNVQYGSLVAPPTYYKYGTGATSRFALYQSNYWYPELTLQDTASLIATHNWAIPYTNALYPININTKSINGITFNGSDSSARNIIFSNYKNFMPNFMGKDNVGAGSDVFSSMHTSNKNIGLGTRVLQYYNGSSAGEGGTGGYMIGIGWEALDSATTAIATQAIGTSAGHNITTASGVNVMGYNGFRELIDGDDNTGIGTEVGEQLFGGSTRNTFGGAQSGYGTPSSPTKYIGYGITGFGWNTLSNLIDTVAGDIALGHAAGANIKTGNYNIIIGSNVGAKTPTISNTLNIGNIIWADGIYGSRATDIGPHGIIAQTNNTPITTGHAGSYSPWFVPELWISNIINGSTTDSVAVLHNTGIGKRLQFIPASTWLLNTATALPSSFTSSSLTSAAGGAFGSNAYTSIPYYPIGGGSGNIISNTIYGTANASTGIAFRFDATSYGGKQWGIGDGTTANGTFSIRDITDSKDVLSIVGATGSVYMSNFYTTSATPSISVTGAGTSPTISISGSNQDQIIQITTGAGSGSMAITVTMSGSFAYPHSCVPTVTAYSSAAQTAGIYVSGLGATNYTINTGATTASTVYYYTVHNGGY